VKPSCQALTGIAISGDSAHIAKMGIPIAIVAGAAMIAAAILVTNHWQIVRTQESLVALRLNRWTGLVEVCMFDLDTQRDPKSLAGVELVCRAK
jgi:hypothetical protein